MSGAGRVDGGYEASDFDLVDEEDCNVTDIVDDKEYKKLQQKEMELHQSGGNCEEWDLLGSEYESIGAHNDASRCWNHADLLVFG